MIGEHKMKKVNDDDLKKVEEICLNTWEHLYRFIYFKVQNCEEAEDITQETYAKTIAYLKKGRIDKNKYISFLRTVAMNLLRDKWRKKKRYGTNINFEEINPEETAVGDCTEDSVNRQVVVDAVNSLGEEQRNIINLRIIKGYTVAETAKITGKTEGAVRSLQYRAIQNLVKILNIE